jgi:hypothetical protein
MGLIEEAYSNMGTSKDHALPDTLLFLTSVTVRVQIN